MPKKVHLQVIKVSVLCKLHDEARATACSFPVCEKPTPLFITVGIMPWHPSPLSVACQTILTVNQAHATLTKAGPKPRHTFSHDAQGQPDMEIPDQTTNTPS